MPNLPKNITDNSLKDLDLIENQETVYLDTSRKGFLLTIDIRGIKTFSFEYKFNKLLRSVSIGTHPNISLNKARLKWLEYSKKVLDGKDIWLYTNVENSQEDNNLNEEKAITRILSEKEITLFWERIDSINQLSAITKLALKLILLTGIQKDDLLLATWDDININKRSWVLNSKKEVFLNSLSIEMLLEIQDFEHHTAYSNTALKQAIIDSNNRVINLSPRTLDRALSKQGCKRLGIIPFQPNDLAETHNKLIEDYAEVKEISVKEQHSSYDNYDSEFIAKYIKSLVDA